MNVSASLWELWMRFPSVIMNMDVNVILLHSKLIRNNLESVLIKWHNYSYQIQLLSVWALKDFALISFKRNFLHPFPKNVSRFIWTRNRTVSSSIQFIVCDCWKNLFYLQRKEKKTSMEMNDKAFARRFRLNGWKIVMKWLRTYNMKKVIGSFVYKRKRCMNAYHLCQDLFDELFVLFISVFNAQRLMP